METKIMNIIFSTIKTLISLLLESKIETEVIKNRIDEMTKEYTSRVEKDRNEEKKIF